jgi:monofunctional biosynthetic peptidoglycan transglycosylase
MAPTRRRSFTRRIVRLLAWLLAIWVVVTVGLVLLFRFVDPPVSSFMAQRMVEATVKREPAFRLAHEWQPLSEISPWLRIAVIASEDQKFTEHRGFDVEALREVAAEHLAGEGGRGASTISQQTAKNLFLWPHRSWVRKGMEAYFTVLIEALWPKRRILEVYLNVAQFGRDIYGAEGAARSFFGKPAALLTQDEAARLAAVLPAPNRYRVQPPSDHVVERAAWIRRQIGALGGPAYLASIGAD